MSVRPAVGAPVAPFVPAVVEGTTGLTCPAGPVPFSAVPAVTPLGSVKTLTAIAPEAVTLRAPVVVSVVGVPATSGSASDETSVGVTGDATAAVEPVAVEPVALVPAAPSGARAVPARESPLLVVAGALGTTPPAAVPVARTAVTTWLTADTVVPSVAATAAVPVAEVPAVSVSRPPVATVPPPSRTVLPVVVPRWSERVTRFSLLRTAISARDGVTTLPSVRTVVLTTGSISTMRS